MSVPEGGTVITESKHYRLHTSIQSGRIFMRKYGKTNECQGPPSSRKDHNLPLCKGKWPALILTITRMDPLCSYTPDTLTGTAVNA